MKDYKELRIIFMGTPEFAIPSLEILLNAGCNVVAVVTSPDKPAGRGLQLQQSAVKQFALSKSLSVLQPEKLKDPAFIETLQSIKADMQVVVAFRMLPEIVWDMPPMGTINVHGSLLPQYRGAAPINWAIINGEKVTGITTFRLQHEIDTGDILMKKEVEIGENETARELHDRMKITGAELLLETIKGISEGNLTPLPQDNTTLPLHHAPKITTATCEIDWNKTTDEVHNQIRGLSPVPAAFTMLDGKRLKIYKSEKVRGSYPLPPGKYETNQKDIIKFACNDGWIKMLELQMEGKKKMKVEDFLRGYRFGEVKS